MFCRKAFFLAGLTLCVIGKSSGQIVTSAQNGLWNDPATWIGGVIPNASNSTSVHIAHAVQVQSIESAPSIVVSSALIVHPGGSIDIVPPLGGGRVDQLPGGSITVSGIFVGRDSVQYNTIASTFRFDAGSSFRYLGSSRGFIPMATWHPESTLLILGFAGSGYIAIAYSESWKQEFGNVIYDCPLQTSFVDLNGYLHRIQGDLIIRNTNNQSLRLSTTQRPVITIGGKLRVEGPSEVWFTTTGDSTRINIGGNIEYYSTSSGPSYLTTRGRCHINVNGAFIVDSPGQLRFCSGSVDSTGVRRATIVIREGMRLTRGHMVAPAPGRGTLVFAGNREQYITSVNVSLVGNIDLHVDPEATVDFQTSRVALPGRAFLRGRVKLGSIHPDGVIQNLNGGNLTAAHGVRFYAGSRLDLTGASAQKLHHIDGMESAHIVCDNPAGVTLAGDLSAVSLKVSQGWLDVTESELSISSHIDVSPQASLRNTGTLRLTGASSSTIGVNGAVIHNFFIQKQPGNGVNLADPMKVKGTLRMLHRDVTLNTNSNLTLLSDSDNKGGSAMVAALPSGCTITGDVTVQRYISGEGRLYRYISAPITNASVASLKDDFPVTGTFADPSSGRGIAQHAPSLFYYDDGWQPYPVSGYASDNPLEVGRGYAAFVRGGNQSVIMDFTGTLTQGSVSLPVKYTEYESTYRGWNLVGNPFPASIDWTNESGWSRSPEVSLSFAIRDNGEERFRYFDGEVGDLEDATIGSCQAFWVHASGPQAAITIHESAKSDVDGAFYRGKTVQPDYIQVKLQGIDSFDEAYLRRKKDALPEFDRHDAVKILNDRISLSFRSADSVPLAIHAVGEIPCFLDVPVFMQYPAMDKHDPVPMPPGSYTLSFEKYGLFRGAAIHILDTFLGDTIRTNDHTFTIDTHPGSSRMDRFHLLVRGGETLFAGVDMLPYSCADSTVTVKLRQTPSVAETYSAEVDGIIHPFGPNGEVSLPRHTSHNNDSTRIRVWAEGLCYRREVQQLVVPSREAVMIPQVSSMSRCGPGTVTFLSDELSEGTTLQWYEDLALTQRVSKVGSAAFTTPHLDSSKTYYVVAVSSAGCRSAPALAEATIIVADPPVIDNIGGTWYADTHSVSWYLGDNLLHVGSTFRPTESGNYKAVSTRGECIATAYFAYHTPVAVEVLPNPVTEQMTIRCMSGGRFDFRVLDVNGRLILKSLGNEGQRVIDTSVWASGLYIVHISADGLDHHARVIKR